MSACVQKEGDQNDWGIEKIRKQRGKGKQRGENRQYK